jgi:hypothetical protein
MSVNTTEIARNLSTKERVENFLNNYEQIVRNIAEAVKNKDLEQLRIIAYQCFNLGREAGARGFIGEVAYTLYPAFQQGNLSGVETFLKNQFPRLKAFLENRLASLSQDVASVVPRAPYWQGAGVPVPPNASVYVIHGGGLQYILDWLKGKEEGYKLERPGKGIQVIPSLKQPSLSDTTRDYATDRSAKSLDYPAYLCAEIEAQYLDSASGDGEAGVRTELRQHLKNIEVEPCLDKQPSIAKSEFEKIPKSILFEAFKIKGSLNFLNERERHFDTGPVEITHFFNVFKNAKSYKQLEGVVSIIQDYVPAELEISCLKVLQKPFPERF